MKFGPPSTNLEPETRKRVAERSMSRTLPALEALALLAVTLPLAVGLRLPTLWFVAPFAVVTLARRPYEDYGLTLRNPGSVGFHVSVCAVVFGLYALAHYLFGRLYLGLEFAPTLPPEFARRAAEQLLVIGLSEEFFFRGYLQTQLNRTFPKHRRFIGAEWGAGLVLAALLFGLCHVVHGDLARMRTFFFGLFAGWLRERTDSIAVPAAYHGVSNLLYDFFQRSLR
jgi:membrane protease YdiL (CAAX protease family)